MIQVGEYVRTNNARGIKKIARINENATVNRYLYIDGYDHSDTIYGIIRADQITKHSFNLIDLIEAGDYVNGDKVVNVINKEPCPSGKCIDIDSAKQSEDCTLWEEDIKTIVTKEQFKSMEYKVVAEDD